MSLEERVAEKVGSELVDLIPKEQWNELIASQVEHFTKNIAPKIIEAELEKRFTEAIRFELSSPEYAETWNQVSQTYTSEAVKKIVIESAPEIFAAMLEPVTSGFIQNLRNQMFR